MKSSNNSIKLRNYKVLNDLREILEYLERINQSSIQLTNLYDNLLNSIKKLNKLPNDLNNYGLGFFLLKNSYPEILNRMKEIGIPLKFTKIQGLNEALKEFKDFKTRLKNNNPILYKEEKNDSQAKFFNIQKSPLDIHLTGNKQLEDLKDVFISYVSKISNVIIVLKSFLKVYSSEVKNFQYKMQKTPKIFRPLRTMLFHLKMNIKYRKKCTKELSVKTNEILNLNKPKYYELPRNIFDALNKLASPNGLILDATDELIEKINNVMEGFNINQYESARTDMLKFFPQLFEYHIELNKYIIRLYYIYTESTRDYEDKYKIETPHYKYKDQIKDYIQDEFPEDFSNLRRVLVEFFNAEKCTRLRNIMSHESPRITLSNDGKEFIVHAKDRKEEVNINRLNMYLRTYIIFIEGLSLY